MPKVYIHASDDDNSPVIVTVGNRLGVNSVVIPREQETEVDESVLDVLKNTSVEVVAAEGNEGREPSELGAPPRTVKRTVNRFAVEIRES